MKVLAEPVFFGESGLDNYGQGGVVVGRTAFFTSPDVINLFDSRRRLVARIDKPEDFPFVVAFDADSFSVKRRYAFKDTYDSTPLVLVDGDRRMVIAHEYRERRTAAREVESGELLWRSEANQPGQVFFGYTFFEEDGQYLVLGAFDNGLHALEAGSGRTRWHLAGRSTGGVTPAVDQPAGVIYYQCDGRVLKVSARDGAVLAETAVHAPNRCYSYNTLLSGDYLATQWLGSMGSKWQGGLRIFDRDLRLVWERKGLPLSHKGTLCAYDGTLVASTGDSWGADYSSDDPRQWKRLLGYELAGGRVAWESDLSAVEFSHLPNVLYFNGSLYAQSRELRLSSKILRLNAADGRLEEIFDYGCCVSSCAQPLIAHGRMYSGDGRADRVRIVTLAEGSEFDWPGPFGHPQHHTMSAPPGVVSGHRVPMRELRHHTDRDYGHGVLRYFES